MIVNLTNSAGKTTSVCRITDDRFGIIFDIMSLNGIEAMYPVLLDDEAAISISGDGAREANLTGEHILRLTFCDSEEAGGEYPGIQEADAERVAGFIVPLLGHVKHIIVQCGAGWSRSAGVACGILEALGDDASCVYDERTPSSRCRRLVHDAMCEQLESF